MLHLVPSDSAGGSMLRALAAAGSHDAVLAFHDDLSCGPIASGDWPERVEWWARLYQRSESDIALHEFWDVLASTDAQIVLWFGRQSASELAFFHACADRLAQRAWSYVDVTGLRLTSADSGLAPPCRKVSIMQADSLRSLFRRERPASPELKAAASDHWRHLRSENAPFRVVSETGLASAPLEIFDAWLLACASSEPMQVQRLVHSTIGANCEPYDQVGDVMLVERVAALVASGMLHRDDNSGDIRWSQVRTPG